MSVELDPVLARIDYEMMQMLRALRDPNCSFKDIGERFNRDSRTVSRILLDFDKVFKANQGEHILERGFGRRGYGLTETGRVFVDNLRPIPDMMKKAVEQAAAATRRVPVVCTSNCLHEYWQELRQALPSSAGFDIVPLPRRTAEIKLRDRKEHPDAQVGLLSAIMDQELHPEVGVVRPWNERIDVLPLRVEPVQLLAVEDLGLSEPVTVRDAVDANLTFLTPDGGVAWDFLQWNFPDWHKLRPFQHIAVPDLEYGLRCLAASAVHRSAMVVHGFRPETRKELEGLKNLRLLDFAPTKEHQVIAVTGVFFVRPEPAEENQGRHPQTLVWEVAKKLWAEREVVI